MPDGHIYSVQPYHYNENFDSRLKLLISHSQSIHFSFANNLLVVIMCETVLIGINSSVTLK